MNKTRLSFFTGVALLFILTGGLRAQTPTSFQRIAISLVGDFQTNTITTNASGTLDRPRIHEFLFATGNIVRAIAIDLNGTNFGAATNWAGSVLLREVNLTNGNEGIFLLKNGMQTNVSSFFGGSFSNNFTGGLSNAFPVLGTGFTNFSFATNGFTDVFYYDSTNELTNLSLSVVANGVTTTFTNSDTNIFTNGFNLATPLVEGRVQTIGTNSTTNFSRTAGLYYLSLNTTNIKFSVVGAGDGFITPVAGAISGVVYQRPIERELIGSAGVFSLQATTNIFNLGTNSQVYYTGPLRGTISTEVPYFASITNGP